MNVTFNQSGSNNRSFNLETITNDASQNISKAAEESFNTEGTKNSGSESSLTIDQPATADTNSLVHGSSSVCTETDTNSGSPNFASTEPDTNNSPPNSVSAETDTNSSVDSSANSVLESAETQISEGKYML